MRAVMRVMKTDSPLSLSLGQLTVHCCAADVSQLLLPSDSDVTETVWRGRGRGRVSARHFVCALTHPSIHPSIHPFFHHLPASARLAEHHDTICSYCPLTPFTHKGPREMHREFPPPVGPNPSIAALHCRQHWAAHTQPGCPLKAQG